MDPPDRSPWSRDMPSVDEIIKRAVRELDLTPDKMREKDPFEVITSLERRCHDIYLEYEGEVRKKAGRGDYGKIDPKEFETSLRNTGMARAGATLEKLFGMVLDAYGIGYDKDVSYFGGEVEFDYVFPDRDAPFREPEYSVLLSLKRKVRERWKLTVGDAYIMRQKYGYPVYDNIWFVSLYEMPPEAVTAMTSLCMRVYVPGDLFDEVLKQVEGRLTEAERRRVKPFSRVIGDIIAITGRRERAEKCTIEPRKLREIERTILNWMAEGT